MRDKHIAIGLLAHGQRPDDNCVLRHAAIMGSFRGLVQLKLPIESIEKTKWQTARHRRMIRSPQTESVMFDPIPALTSAHLSQLERHEDAAERAHNELRALMVDTLIRDPADTVPVVRFDGRTKYSSAAEVAIECHVSDELAVDLFRLVGMCEKSADPALRICAQSILARIADDYANTHCDGYEVEQ